MGFIVANDGTKLFCRDWGAGPEVMVFLASQALPSDIWNYNLPFFSERGIRCISLDRRGHGRSDEPSGGYDIDTLARDVATVLAAKDVRDVTLVGHSLGGGEAIRYLARHDASKRIARVVLIGATAPVFDPAMAAGIAAVWQRDFAGWIAINKRAFFAPETSDALVDWGARLMEAIPLHVVLQLLKTTSSLDLREDLGTIEIPALVIHGARDASIPVALGEATANLLKRARFVRYDDAAHGVLVTHAERVNRDILAFMS